MKPIWWFLFFVFTLAAIGRLGANSVPVVSNVLAAQRTDGSRIVDIWYSVNDADGDTLTVSVAVSNDNGVSFGITPAPANLSGAIDENILSGTNKHILWNAGAEGIAFDGNQYKVKVIATEKINLNLGLVAYYPFNGNANDESGNGRHGTLMNSPSFAIDRFGEENKTVRFFAGSNYVNIPYYYYGLNPITISCWFKSTAEPINDWCGAISIYDDLTAVDYRILQTNNTIAVAQHNPWVTWNVTTHYTITLNEWYHIILRYENRNLSFYVNGILIDSIVCSQPIHVGNWDTSYCIGKGFSEQGSEIYSINADIDDVRFYHRALSPTEIQALYHEGGWPLTKQDNPNSGEE